MATEKSTVTSPEGTKALMLSMRDMEKYGLKTGKGIKDTVDHHFLPKSEILEEIKKFGFMCAFHEHLKEIEAFTGDTILIIADPDENYGENWILCTTDQGFENQIKIINEKSAETQRLLEEEERKKKEEQDALNVEYEDKPIIASEWISDTSSSTHEEVRKLDISGQRHCIILTITRPRKDFHMAYKFSDRDADQSFVECRQHKDPNYELHRTEQDIGLQATLPMTDMKTQTNWFRSVNSSIQYEANKLSDIDRSIHFEHESVLLFLHESESLMEEALQQNETLDLFADELSWLNEEDSTLGHKTENQIKELRTFTDLVYSKNKILSTIDWHPRRKGVIGVSACSTVTFDERVVLSERLDTSYILIWNFKDLIHPQLMLEAQQDVYTFRFNPTQPHIVVAGTFSGQIVLWDIKDTEFQIEKNRDNISSNRRGSTNSRNGSKESNSKESEEDGFKSLPPIKYSRLSYIDTSHRRPVTDLVWLPPGVEVTNKGHVISTIESVSYQFITVAGDGQVCFWDIRLGENNATSPNQPLYRKSKTDSVEGYQDQNFQPFYKVILNKIDGVGELGLTKISLEGSQRSEKGDSSAPSFSTRFYCSTEEGQMVYADWKPHGSMGSSEESGRQAGSSASSVEETSMDYVQWVGQDFFRPSVALEASPFFPEILLSAGEWTFHLWRKGWKQPIFSSSLASAYVTTAIWSKSRPGVIVVGKVDGTLDVWDLVDQSHRPYVSVPIAPAAITSLSYMDSKTQGFSNKQQLLAAGDALGNLHILDIPRNLFRPLNNERSLMESFFQREMNRVQYIGKHIEDLTSKTEECTTVRTTTGHEKPINPEEETHSNDEVGTKTNLLDEQVYEAAEQEFIKLEAAFREELEISDENIDENSSRSTDHVAITNQVLSKDSNNNENDYIVEQA